MVDKPMQQIGTKEILDEAQLIGPGEPLGIEQEIKICPSNQTVYAQTRIYPRK